MKICPYCGKRQSDEYNFCTYCNKELYPIAGAEPVHLAPPPEEIQ
ncbi:MAG: zinc-ribbon domain-containing protein, partial [Candidatus Thermoplasmatota archaeon]